MCWEDMIKFHPLLFEYSLVLTNRHPFVKSLYGCTVYQMVNAFGRQYIVANAT